MDERQPLPKELTESLAGRQTDRLNNSGIKTPMPSLGYLDKGTMIADRYRVIVEQACSGGEADVFICQDDQTEERVAVKVYRGNLSPNINLLNTLLEAAHENIVRTRYVGEWNQRFIEVMEYAEGGTLADHMPFDEEFLSKLVIPQVAEALNYLHKNRIVHRDLKPSNLFFKDNHRKQVLLGDYGISSMVQGDGSLHFTSSGSRTLAFMAPELGHLAYGYGSDYYALGITLLFLLSGESPFEGMTDNYVIVTHLSGDIFPPQGCSDRFKSLIQGLLHKSREKRWGYEELQRWLNGENVAVAPQEYKGQQFSYKLGPDLVAHSPEELGTMMLQNPERAKRHIRRPPFYEIFTSYDQDRATRLNEFQNDAGTIDELFIGVVYTLNPELPYLFEGHEVRKPQELAQLIDRDEQTWAAAKEQLYNGCIPAWLRAIGYEAIAEEWKKVSERFTSPKS